MFKEDGTKLKKGEEVDFVIIEGFKTYWHPKIETYLSGNSHEPLIATSKNIIGLVHDLDYFEGEQEHFRFEEKSDNPLRETLQSNCVR